MNFYKNIEPIFDYLVSIRKLENYISIDVRFNENWKILKRFIVNGECVHQESNSESKLFSFVTKFDEVELNNIIDSISNIIKYNKEIEEKNRLFEQKVNELKDIFEKQNLNSLQLLDFKLDNNINIIEDNNEE